ncbi:hypothetical protein MRX96_057600 [Rhipicephalus microplus]
MAAYPLTPSARKRLPSITVRAAFGGAVIPLRATPARAERNTLRAISSRPACRAEAQAENGDAEDACTALLY